MLLDTLISKNITNRNVAAVLDLGVSDYGEWKFRSIELFERGVSHNYPCECDRCGHKYNMFWSKLTNSDTPSDHIQYCGKCRLKLAADKMRETMKTSEFRAKRTEQNIKSAHDPKNAEVRRLGAKKRKDGWCKTDEAKVIARANLVHHTGENHGRWNPDKRDFEVYRTEVYRLTRQWDERLIDGFVEGKRGLCGVDGAIQLDHVVSVKYGYDNNISPEVIGHLCNLEFLPWKDNRGKGSVTEQKDLERLQNMINKLTESEVQ